MTGLLFLPRVASADEPARPESTKTIVVRDMRAEAEPVPLERRSTGLFAGGIVVVSVGGLGMLLGAAFAASQESSYSSCQSANDTLISVGYAPNSCEKDYVPGIAMLVASSLVMGAGIPMVVIGNQKVPGSENVSLSVAPRPDGGAAKVVVSF